jgi:hypothetical protein
MLLAAAATAAATAAAAIRAAEATAETGTRGAMGAIAAAAQFRATAQVALLRQKKQLMHYGSHNSPLAPKDDQMLPLEEHWRAASAAAAAGPLKHLKCQQQWWQQEQNSYFDTSPPQYMEGETRQNSQGQDTATVCGCIT